ncbi:MAG: hypothetical protein IT432_00740 [Phycisphaerales bacterium]|nr:hypothetical protein [Phycisphaerales bacterium]
MTWKSQYERAKAALLVDSTVCEPNRTLFADFFAFQEHKLKRQNGLPALDEGCCNTLYSYVLRFRNVNAWFDNKPWIELTREDIRSVYDALEDGTIRNKKGTLFIDRQSYYNKVFKSKPFRLAGKDRLAQEVIEYSTDVRPPVRYITEEMFRRLIAHVHAPRHLLLFWLAWDIGENINSLLQLTAQDFIPRPNRYTGELEYVVNLAGYLLKRSRTSRGEVTLYPETAHYARIVLSRLAPQDRLFTFGYRRSAEILKEAAVRSGATTMPHALPVRWKDLRSGMACHLLRHGLTRDEVNARLGHTPHSAALDAYINHMALDRDQAKQRLLASGRAYGAVGAQQPAKTLPTPTAPPWAVAPEPAAATPQREFERREDAFEPITCPRHSSLTTHS